MESRRRECATVLLWSVGPQNRFGHATIQTNTYHMSLWPDGDIKNDYGYIESHNNGVDGSLVIHHDLDRHLENKRNPTEFHIDWTDNSFLTMKKIDENYENMLNYNDITPDRVTLDYAEGLISKKERPEISLKKSLYSFRGEKFETNEFYKYKQSCTTFTTALLLNSGVGGVLRNYLFKIRRNEFPPELNCMEGQQIYIIAGGLFQVGDLKTMITKKFDFKIAENNDSCSLV